MEMRTKTQSRGAVKRRAAGRTGSTASAVAPTAHASGAASPSDIAATIRRWCKPYPAGECCMCQQPPEEECDEECRVPALMLAANYLDSVAALLVALKSVLDIAREAHREWDGDNDMRVGKILIALAGYQKGYRADIDAVHAAIAKAESR